MLFENEKNIGHITKAKTQNDVSNFYFVGAFIERPRATNGRPYEALKGLINQGLLACFLDSNSYGYGHTNHGVVTCADETHHLFGQTAVEAKKP